MPRIRTIKPEFWDSPGTARAGLRARLFFIAMWGWADDWGIGTANAKQLIGYAFPNDDDVTAADFPRLATEVSECFDVAWYEVDGRPYFAIPSWDSHQKNERRAAKRNPTPDQGISIIAEARGSSVRPHGETPVGTGEQGNRGTGEQGNSYPAPAVLDSEFIEAWGHWPKKVERKDALEQFKKATKRIDVEELVAAIIRFGDAYAATRDKQFVPALGVWLKRDRWTDDIPVAPSQNGRPSAAQKAASLVGTFNDPDAWMQPPDALPSLTQRGQEEPWT